MLVIHVHFLLNHIIDIDCDIGLKRFRMNKIIAHEKEHRIFLKKGNLRQYCWNCDHISGIKNQDAGISVIGMIIIWPRKDDNISLLFSDQLYYLQSVFISWHQLSVVIVESYISYT